MTLLVVSATPEEAAHVPSAYRVLITGVGKVPAAAAVAATLAADPSITEVVNIGSAGALHDHLEGLHVVGSVHNHDLSADALRNFGYDPQEWLTLSPEPIRLATGDLFVSDPVVRARLADLADLADMEGYAVAWAARQAAVPVTLVKHVSDQADEGALAWAEVVERSARDLADWLVTHRPVDES
ncbi:nucleosidase [Nocardioides sp. Kera G14]|uniref:nucleosidase n=1 Tax=Nocardioides sp. Kera G14 TaxID=2884264 RepID=UPI001D11BAFC|nr:nucleosidase [Nocardioides sp. Kera G14]UDY25155.1 nucleosidase [Nocardioides sp. Kera G14]